MIATCLLSAAVLLDFETAAERQSVEAFSNRNESAMAVRPLSLNGEWNLHLHKRTWREGMPDKDGIRCVLRPPLTDWSGYDRLVIELFNDDVSGDWLYFRGVAKEAKWESGYYASVALPSFDRLRWVVPLKAPKGFDASRVEKILLNTSSRPKGVNLHVDRMVLLKPGESIPPVAGTGFPETLVPRYRKRIAELERELADAQAAARHVKAVVRFADRCRAAGTAHPAFCLGRASAMEQVLPRDDFDAEPATELSLRLARNERESVQLVVLSPAKDLRNARVVAKVPGFADAEISVRTVGYVRTEKPCYLVKAVGWWPDPLLGFLSRTDVAAGDAQAFWITVKCPEGRKPGRYEGTVTVSAEGVAPVCVPFHVRVNSFAIPRTAPLPLAVTFRPNLSTKPGEWTEEETKRIRADPNAPVNAWRRHAEAWYALLADYWLEPLDLYGWPKFPMDEKKLAYLRDRGWLGCFNLGYWKPFPRGDRAAEEWRENHLPGLRARYARAKALGIADRAYLYGADEEHPGAFDRVAAAVALLKTELPDVPVSTTSFDGQYGVDGSKLAQVDWFTPKVAAYDPAQAAKARAAGKQVWWYDCDIPHAPYPVHNVDNPVIMTRVLMGAMTAKYRPDGYLYWQTANWRATKTLRDGGSFTDWPGRSFGDYNGDGSWTYAGPDGIPVASIRMENFRDGLEDLAYVKLLEARGEKVEIPPDVVRSTKQYTLEAGTVQAWRDGLADRLEGMKK